MTTNEELRALAEQATAGEWAWAHAPAEGGEETPIEYIAGALTGREQLAVVWVPETEGDAEGYRLTAITGDAEHAQADAAFIAAANPERVLALLDEVERLRAQVGRVEALAEEMGEGKAFTILTMGRESEYPISYFIEELEKALDVA